MASAGTFVLESNDNYDAWLKAVGIPDDVAGRMSSAKPKLEVTTDSNGVTVKTISGDKVFTNAVIFGQDSLTDVAGFKYTLNVAKTDMGYKGTITLGSKSGTVSVENTATGFTQTTTIDGITAKRVYVKQ